MSEETDESEGVETSLIKVDIVSSLRDATEVNRRFPEVRRFDLYHPLRSGQQGRVTAERF